MAVGGASIDRATLDAPDFTLPGGRQLPMSVAHIVDDAGNVVPPGVAGEIVVRGPNVATGIGAAPRHLRTLPAVIGGTLAILDAWMIEVTCISSHEKREKDFIKTEAKTSTQPRSKPCCSSTRP